MASWHADGIYSTKACFNEQDLRIYLGEDLFPTFEEDKLVFKETGIELGDWKENRKASVNVPLSAVCTVSGYGLICRLFRITDHCSLISLSLKREQYSTLRTRISTQNVPSTQLNVCSARIAPLTLVLTRYMPKKKEIHLKKLIKSSEETEKEVEVEVFHQSYQV